MTGFAAAGRLSGWRERATRVLVVRNPDGSTQGVDPRSLPQAILDEFWPEPVPVLSAIRDKCIDCCAGSVSEVAKCVSVACALWPFRMNANPFRKGSSLSEEERARRADRLRAWRAQ